MQHLTFSILLALFPAIATADVVWPGLYIYVKTYSLLPILCGLLFEFIIFKQIFKLKFLKCIVVVLVVNAVSALVGYFLYVWYGLGITFIAHSIQYLFNHHAGTFNPFIWTCDFMAFALFTTILEYIAIRFIFKIKFKIKSKTFLWFLLANILSTGVAALSAMVDRPIL